MKNSKVIQFIPANTVVKKVKGKDKIIHHPARKVEHLKPLSPFKQKMSKLRMWLYDNYEVLSFTKLKQRGSELSEIRKKGLKYAGLK